jgi:hypothetical protein
MVRYKLAESKEFSILHAVGGMDITPMPFSDSMAMSPPLPTTSGTRGYSNVQLPMRLI